MASPLTQKVTFADLRAARTSGRKWPMLTCYDFTMARLMQQAGVPMLLVGDSAANVVLGYPTTLPVSLSFMIEITAAVRRGAPLSLLMADMPFGSYQASVAQGVASVCRMVQKTDCDCVKLEVGPTHLPLISALADAGIAVVAHLGLRPQSVGLLGGYRAQGRSAAQAQQIVALALQMQRSGAAAVLLEAVPPEVANAVIAQTAIPIIGCGAGPGCHSCVIVTHDGLGLTLQRPRFVPDLGRIDQPLLAALGQYVEQVTTGAYPASEHQYIMPPDELKAFLAGEDKIADESMGGSAAEV